MLIVVLVVLCVASLAAAELQTMRLRTLQQKMDALRQNVEHEVRKQEALWHDMVHDLRNPAACMYSLAQLIQENRNGDPEQLSGRDAQIVLESIAGHGRPGTATAGYEGCVW